LLQGNVPCLASAAVELLLLLRVFGLLLHVIIAVVVVVVVFSIIIAVVGASVNEQAFERGRVVIDDKGHFGEGVDGSVCVRSKVG